MKNSVIIFLLLVSNQLLFSQSQSVDSINYLYNKSRNEKLSLNEQFAYAYRAYNLAKETGIDSLILKNGRNLSKNYMFLDNYELFKNQNYKNLKLANKLKDSLFIAQANHNLAWYYDYNSKSDSAYYYYKSAYNFYTNKVNQAAMLLDMANIQEEKKDNLGAQNNAFKAIKILEAEPKTERGIDLLWSLYNVVGVTSLNMRFYNDALSYHDKALNIVGDNNEFYYNKLLSKNNIALVYKDKGEFNKAVRIYKDELENPKIKTEIDAYVLFLDNLGYTMYLAPGKNKSEILNLYQQAYKLSDSIGDTERKLYTSLNLGKYYLNEKDTVKAINFSREAENLARKTSLNEALLEALKLQSQLYKGKKGKDYLYQYIAFSDSLQVEERSIRERFARLEYETDQIIAEKEQISRERFLFLLLSIGLLLTLFLVYIIIGQRARNNQLLMQQQQQQANEDIYNLMLQQQDKVDEARAIEKRKISEELHDGVLSRLFGARLSLDSINMSSTEEAIKTRSNYINELKSIEEDIRKVSHELNVDFISGSGFMDIVKSLVETQCQAFKLEYQLKYDDTIIWEHIPNKTKIHFYRIVQESLQNIHKHANANQVKINFAKQNDNITLSITDNGIGFDTNKMRKGIGLKNMNSRVETIKGKLNIKSQQEKGTNVIVEVPLNKAE